MSNNQYISPLGYTLKTFTGPDRSSGDNDSGYAYVWPSNLQLAVDTALVLGRPLLLKGPPGCGKSSLAPYMARCLGRHRDYYSYTVRSDSRASDLLYSFDALQKLSDAHTNSPGKMDNAKYIYPGPLWKMINPESAEKYPKAEGGAGAQLPSPLYTKGECATPDGGCVLLIDEIDKADSSFPNDLLVTIGLSEFRVNEINLDVKEVAGSFVNAPGGGAKRARLFIVVTTNSERDLPDAFVRRCVVMQLEHPGKDQLIEIWRSRPGGAEFYKENKDIVDQIADDLISEQKKLSDDSPDRQTRSDLPGAAEFIDMITAYMELGMGIGAPLREKLKAILFNKR